jgi:sortase A
MRIIGKIVKIVVGLFCMFFGIFLFLYTDIHTVFIDYRTKCYIEEFNKVHEKDKKSNKKNSDLYKEIKAYNQNIYESGQSSFNANSLKDMPITFTNLADGKFGYIEIPSMGKTFPLYLGANDENMEKGLAIMGQTSIPIGGKNTNSVIAGHRGWETGNFLRKL